jgi:GNAT superfamily N-acetyltransferase
MAEAVCASWEWAYAGIIPDEMMARGSNRPRRESGIQGQMLAGNLALVAEAEDGTIAGVAMDIVPPRLAGWEAELAALYVHPACAGKGAGTLLVRGMAAEYLSAGKETMAIRVLRENRIGRSFYEKVGGTVISEGDCEGEDSVWYGWSDLSLLVSET